MALTNINLGCLALVVEGSEMATSEVGDMVGLVGIMLMSMLVPQVLVQTFFVLGVKGTGMKLPIAKQV